MSGAAPSSFALHAVAPGESAAVRQACPLCGEAVCGDALYDTGGLDLRACPSCGFVYALKARPPRPAHPAQGPLGKLWRLRLHLLPRKHIALLLEAWAKPGAVADLGCGDGHALEDLGAGFTPIGVEASPALARVAHERYQMRGGACVNGPVLEALGEFPDGFFSAAVMRSYLHLEPEPLAVLAQTFRVLAPDGVAVVKVPNLSSLNRQVMKGAWCGFRDPAQLNFFTPGTLQKMARKAGFSVHFGITFTLPTSDNLYAVLRRDKSGPRPPVKSCCGGGCS